MAYTVYLVDTDRFILDLYAVKFTDAGHSVASFASGSALLAALRGGNAVPDAILLEVAIPDMTGFEVLETMRKERLVPGAKIVIFSNRGRDADIERARSLAADAYIVKSSAVPSEVLSETIRTIEAGAPITH